MDSINIAHKPVRGAQSMNSAPSSVTEQNSDNKCINVCVSIIYDDAVNAVLTKLTKNKHQPLVDVNYFADAISYADSKALD